MVRDPNVALHTMRCVHGSNYDEWDPGSTYVVQRLWDQTTPLDEAFLSI